METPGKPDGNNYISQKNFLNLHWIFNDREMEERILQFELSQWYNQAEAET